MALRPEYSLGHSEFNDFLFAFVGEEKSGIQLTVLSALARLGLEPWGEAARLSGLPRDAAATALAAAIETLPEGNWKSADLRSIAVRLVDRLPKHIPAATRSRQGGGMRDQKPTWDARRWMIWIGVFAAIVIAVSRLYGG